MKQNWSLISNFEGRLIMLLNKINLKIKFCIREVYFYLFFFWGGGGGHSAGPILHYFLRVRARNYWIILRGTKAMNRGNELMVRGTKQWPRAPTWPRQWLGARRQWTGAWRQFQLSGLGLAILNIFSFKPWGLVDCSPQFKPCSP